jgi:hypothetical protein
VGCVSVRSETAVVGAIAVCCGRMPSVPQELASIFAKAPVLQRHRSTADSVSLTALCGASMRRAVEFATGLIDSANQQCAIATLYAEWLQASVRITRAARQRLLAIGLDSHVRACRANTQIRLQCTACACYTGLRRGARVVVLARVVGAGKPAVVVPSVEYRLRVDRHVHLFAERGCLAATSARGVLEHVALVAQSHQDSVRKR